MAKEITSAQATASQPDSTKKACCRSEPWPAWVQAIASVAGVLVLLCTNGEVSRTRSSIDEVRQRIAEIEEHRAILDNKGNLENCRIPCS